MVAVSFEAKACRRLVVALAAATAVAMAATPLDAFADLIVPGQPYRRPNRRPDPPEPAPKPVKPTRQKPTPIKPAPAKPAMAIGSTAFVADGAIPQVHTCEGADTSPPLAFRGVPSGAKTLALIVDDPDAPDPAAPKRTYVHWVMWNLPAATAGLAENASSEGLPEGTAVGRNDWDKTTWGGPCPPIGRHRYFFKLYALDTTLPPPGAKPWNKAELHAAMAGHIVAETQIVGTYQKAAKGKAIGKLKKAAKPKLPATAKP